VATSALGGRLDVARLFGKSKQPSEFLRPKRTKNSFLDVRKTALVNRTDEVPDELALIQSERISTQWTNELRKNIRVYPTCKMLKAILSLDVYMQTVVYAFLIKGWSSSRIAEHLDVSLIKIQEILKNGRQQLKRKLVEPHYPPEGRLKDRCSCVTTRCPPSKLPASSIDN